ncbi:CLUMA_CG012564, isoform A [Clunio marinus]|uniref:CLUMA_CG012564, isoform A n=1 Tax=Clunio marinus TaxID=568069 RepID=A0A1J1IG84_9DIPT|nr:CLUMA_CG012564, isoform A [Clunio marinus]
MSPLQWLSLLLFYICYLLFGTCVFYYQERRLETLRRNAAYVDRLEVNALMIKYLSPNNTELQQLLLERVSDYCEQPLTHPSQDDFVAPYVWSFYHTFFFTFTVSSTIGYGNLSPNNTFGRMFTIFYALIGIPVHAILFAYLGEFWGRMFLRLYERYKKFKLSSNDNWVPPQFSLIVQIILYVIPAIIFFIFLPAFVFSYFEGWDYSISVYYSFITLTTIGFGDFVATFQPHQPSTFGNWYIFYQTFMFAWFFLGLGYLIMVIGFIIKGLRSKQIKRIEHQLAMNIKETRNKIWHGVSKDVGYIRKILNEVHLLKIKPIYIDKNEVSKKFFEHRSHSCPDLFRINYNDENEMMKRRRKRAYSECEKLANKNSISNSITTLHRVQSDSSLRLIDKAKTFSRENSQQSNQAGDFLTKLIVSLSDYRSDKEEPSSLYSTFNGINSLDDLQLFPSEQTFTSNLSFSGSEKGCITPPILRGQHYLTTSGVNFQNHEPHMTPSGWTWSGNNTIPFKADTTRTRFTKPKENLYKSSFAAKMRHYSETMTADISQDKGSDTGSNNSTISRLNPFRKKNAQKRTSIASTASPRLDTNFKFPKLKRHNSETSQTSQSNKSTTDLRFYRPNNFTPQSAKEEQNMLETTSIADLIRALEKVHTATVEAEQMQETLKKATKILSLRESLFSIKSPKKKNIPTNMRRQSTPQLSTTKPCRLHSSITSPQNTEEHRARILGDSNPFNRMPPPSYTSSPEPLKEPLKPALKQRFIVRPANIDSAPGNWTNSTTVATSPTQQQLSTQGKITWCPTTSSLAVVNEVRGSGRRKSNASIRDNNK